MDRLRSEKFLWKCFRTGVRLPSAPPKESHTNQAPTIYMVGGVFVLACPLKAEK